MICKSNPISRFLLLTKGFFLLLLDFSTMKVILMQHTANCRVTHSFPCSIFNNSSKFRGTQPRIFSYFIKYIPFFSSTEYFSLWFSSLILYGSNIFKLINNILYSWMFYWQVVLFWADNDFLGLSLPSSASGLH